MSVCGCVSSRKYKPDPTRESEVGEVGDIAPFWSDQSPELDYLVMRCCNAVYFLGVRQPGTDCGVTVTVPQWSSAQNYDAVKSVVRVRERCSWWCRGRV